MSLVLWIVQILLAGMFGMAGFMKMTAPIPELSQSVIWAKDVPVALVRFIGTSEFLGALGLILPSVTRIMPKLTPLAALGLVTVMLLAVVFHLMRGEPQFAVFTLVLAAIAAFVAWGRFTKAPISAR